MRPRFILFDLYYNIKTWMRSKGTVFWTLLFPVLLILIFGAIFLESDNVEYDLVIQDLDESVQSEEFVKILKNISVFNIIEIESNEDVEDYMKDNDKSSALQIPEDFGSSVQMSFADENVSTNLTFYNDPSEQTTTGVVRNVVSNALNEYNMGITQGRRVVGMDDESTVGDDFEFIDFFVPGIIGFTIMTSCIYGSIERNTKYRKDGILRKLLTTPVTRTEWIVSKMLFMLFLSFVSTVLIIVVGMAVWGLSVKINFFFFVIIIATSFLFSGMGMIVGRFVKEEETADMAGGAITFPMMFLAGTFFPLEQMPDFLQTVAQFLPLYYVNEALRNSMIYADFDKSVFFTAFVLVFAFVFFIIGVFVTKWKED